MILVQALVVAGIGYGLGIGLATIFGIVAEHYVSMMAFFLPWQVLVLTGIAVLLIALVASLISIRRVLVLEPAIVFQGGA
jgi:putative ABC transport system permease protein